MAHRKNSIHTLLQLIYYRRSSSFCFSRICCLEVIFSLFGIFRSASLFSIVTMGVRTITFISELICFLLEGTYTNSEGTTIFLTGK